MATLRVRWLPGVLVPCLVLLAACSVIFRRAGVEQNIGFHLERNRPVLEVEVNGRPATMVLATALERSVISHQFVDDDKPVKIFFGNLNLTRVRPTPLELDGLGADGLLGADAFRGRALTIDYHRGLVTLGDSFRPEPEFRAWHFDGPPTAVVEINGESYPAVIDTALPDSAIIPKSILAAGASGRGVVDLHIAGVRFDKLDVGTGPGTDIRIGNRVLSRFIIKLDYSNRIVAMWADPRTATTTSR